MTSGEEYLEVVEADDPSIATAEIMDRLSERLKSIDSTADALSEMKAAGEAIAELAKEAENSAAVIDQARNGASDVAQQAQRKKESIIERIEAEVDDVLKEESDGIVRLENVYGLDRYLENDLEEVEIVRSTDHVTDPTFRWKFSDGARIEHDDSVHMDRYNFWKKLVQGSQERLTHEMASEQIGDPDENEQRYRELSLGPKSRPWHPTKWVECIQDLLEERSRVIETDGPRTGVWEDVQDWIRQTRAVADMNDAIVDSQAHVVEFEDGETDFGGGDVPTSGDEQPRRGNVSTSGDEGKAADGGNHPEFAEIWVPASVINKICEEWGLGPNALQAELSERGVDSDDVAGGGLSDAFFHEGRATRFWRFDGTHGEVPMPQEVVEELDDGLDRDLPGQGFSYGGGDGE